MGHPHYLIVRMLSALSFLNSTQVGNTSNLVTKNNGKSDIMENLATELGRNPVADEVLI
jgi:hypothetical protein